MKPSRTRASSACGTSGTSPQFAGLTADTTKDAFRLERSPYADWELGYFSSLRDMADALIVIGGGNTTLASGLVVSAWKKPVLAAPHFGGKSEILYKFYNVAGSGDSVVAGMSGEWDAEQCVKQVLALVQAQRRSGWAEAARRRYFDAVTSAALPALGVCALVLTVSFILVAALAGGSDGKAYAPLARFVAILIGAGALGALSRKVLWRDKESRDLLSLVALGSLIGMAVGFIEITPRVANLVTSNGALNVGAPEYVTSFIIALVGSLALDTSFERLASRADPSPSAGRAAADG